MTKKDKKARAAARCAARHAESAIASEKEAYVSMTIKNSNKIRHELAVIMVAMARVLIGCDSYYRLLLDRKEAVEESIKEALQEVCSTFIGDSYAWYYDGWRAMRSFATVKMSLEEVYGPLGTKVYGDGSRREYISAKLTEQMYLFIVGHQELPDEELVEAISSEIELD